MRYSKTITQLNDLERKVYDLCNEDDTCTNSNTLLCVRFWQRYNTGRGEWYKNFISTESILKYPPESITRARRHLVEWKLLTPNKEIQEKRMETAQSWKNTPQLAQYNQENIRWINGQPYKIS